MILAILLVASCVGLLYGRNWVSDTMDSESKCRDFHELKVADDAISEAAGQFCQYACPCDADKDMEDDLPDNYVAGSAKKITKCKPCESLDKEV
jgi:hypothetical protein